MNLEIILIQFFQITILTLSTFSIVMIFLLLFSPDLFKKISKTSNTVISTKSLLKPLDSQREADTKIFLHSGKLSALIIIISILSLYMLLSSEGLFNTAHFVKTGKAMEWLISILIQSTAWFFLVFLSFSIIIAIMMLVIPDNFSRISDFFNQWISTSFLYGNIDVYKNFDSFFMKFRLPLGIICLILLFYVIYACFIKLILLNQ